MSKTNSRIKRTYPVANSPAARVHREILAGTVARTGAGDTGTLSNWTPQRLGWQAESFQRVSLVERSNALVANDPHAASLTDSIGMSSVGTGLRPQSKPRWKRLGITEQKAAELAEQFEWVFSLWSRNADASGWNTFDDIQLSTVNSVLVNGEFLHLPIMRKRPNIPFSLALQQLDPLRLCTPAQLQGTKNLRDGIRTGSSCEPLSYFIADPDDGILMSQMDMRNFREYPAWRGHRPVVMHRFVKKTAEQVRGLPIISPGMKFFRDLGDYLDFELVGNIIAASFPVFIEDVDPVAAAERLGVGVGGQKLDRDSEEERFTEVQPGNVMWGQPGQKPHILKGDRPGNSFGMFVETILRAVGACAGMPYEVIAKDFSKTNYSSARAALEEAWRVFGFYRQWMVNHFCQLIWEMVLEEAFLRRMISLPTGAPDFYAAKAEYCNARWTGPPRGTLDPVKEIVAAVMAKNNNLLTDADYFSGQGKDWVEQKEQRSREKKKDKKLGIETSGDTKKPKVDRQPKKDDD